MAHHHQSPPMMDPRHDMSGGFQMPNMQAPLLMNPPPQIFGGYGHELAQLDLSQPMFDNGTLLDESNEAKRRRIARACDCCRKKKIKCDGKIPSCSHCLNYKTECLFTQVEKKRNPPKGAKYIESLENRMGHMENLLVLTGVIKEDDNGRTDLGALVKHFVDKNRVSQALDESQSASPSQASHHSTPNEGGDLTPRSQDHIASPEPTISNPTETQKKKSKSPDLGIPEEEVAELSDMMCSLVTNNCGETRYIGSSSGFSIFSPKGIQWVNDKTGDKSFQTMISSASVDEDNGRYWRPEVFHDLFDRKLYMKLPLRNECISLLKDFFENFNCMFPLFHQPTFMHLVEREYGDDPYRGSGWWASLNVALAISHRLRVMSNLVPVEEDNRAWGYLKNALAVLPELTMRNTDLLSVQAILGMALFMQGTPNQQPTFFLVSAAIRLSHSIGLHKRGSGFNLNPVEIEQRKRVFWIAYMLDKDICLRSGRPPAQDDDDTNVELPSADPADNVGNIPLADGKGKVNIFRVMCEFSVIESKVYRQLYSVKASKQSDGELLNTIGDLDRELEEWKDAIPIDFRPEHEIKASHTPLILHVVVLHFTYYNCLTTIHRMSIHHGYWTSRLSNYAIQGLNARPLNPRVFSSAPLCVAAARASIHLIKYVPQGDMQCVWLILYFPVSALVTLFGNILQNPGDPRARADVRLMGIVVNFLSPLVTDKENGGVKRMLGVCSEFERIATVVIDKAEKDSSRRKRKHAEEPPKQKSHPVVLPPSMAQHAQVMAMAGTSFGPAMPPPNGFGGSPMNANMNDDMNDNMNANMSGSVSGSMNGNMNGSPQPGGWQADYSNGREYTTPNPNGNGLEITSFDGFSYPPGWEVSHRQDVSSPLNVASFQQPFVPQDVWQIPMGLDWDWRDMTGGTYPSFENGIVGDPNLQQVDNQHLQHQTM